MTDRKTLIEVELPLEVLDPFPDSTLILIPYLNRDPLPPASTP
jgi:hypothetical protein